MTSYRLSENYSVRKEDFGSLSFNRLTWSLHHSNIVGATILEMLSLRRMSLASIYSNLTRCFGPLDVQQEGNVVTFLDQLIQHAIIKKSDLPDDVGDFSAFTSYDDEIHSKKSECLTRYLRSPVFVWWDITSACNLKCKQCYSSSGKPLDDEFEFSQVCEVLDDLASMNVFYVYFLGGEPFMRKDFLAILEHSRAVGLEVMINTNGWFISDQLANDLASLDIRKVRVSIDGATSNTHDSIRGVPGSFERAINAVKHLKSAGISSVGITPTMMHENINEAQAMVDLARKLNSDEIQLVQVCPVGRGETTNSLDLSDLDILRTAINEKASEIGDTLQISSSEGVWERPFFNCVMEGQVFPQIMGCGAGRTCFAISPNGQVRACLLYHRHLADLNSQSIGQIWSSNDIPNLQQLRQVKNGCKGCGYSSVCSGPCPMQEVIGTDARRCFVRENLDTDRNLSVPSSSITEV